MAAASASARARRRVPVRVPVGVRVRLRLVCSFLSIKVTADEAVNEDFSHLINNDQGQGQSQRQRFISAGRSGEDEKRDTDRTNVCRFTHSGTSRLCLAQTGFFVPPIALLPCNPLSNDSG